MLLGKMHDADYTDMARQISSRHRQIEPFDISACQLSEVKGSWI